MMQELEFFQKTGKRTKRRVNTANILFILSGAFSGLSDVVRRRLTKQSIGFGSRLNQSRDEVDLLKQTRAEDLVKFGFESEFIGRVPVRCVLDTLDKDDLYAVLKMPNNPVILNKRLDFCAYGLDIVFSDNALKILAERAFKENTGARGLVSVVEDALLPFEERLPSTSVGHLTVNQTLLTSPKTVLKQLEAGENLEAFEAEFKRVKQDFTSYITTYLKDNWKRLSIRHGLTLSRIRCDLVAQYFVSNVIEVDDAVKQIKKFYDSVKEIEVEISKSYDMNVVFEEDAIDFLIEQFVEHRATSEEILRNIYDKYYDGFNLVREKTGKNRFFLSKKALLDHNEYLNHLIRKEIQ